MNDSNPYQSSQVVEQQAPQPVTAQYAGDVVPADFTMRDLMTVLGVTAFMITVALAVPLLFATLFGR